MKKLFFIVAALYSVVSFAHTGKTTDADKSYIFHSVSDRVTALPGEEDSLFYPTPDSLATTYDSQGKVSTELRLKIFNLYNEKRWNDLELIFNAQELNSGWPLANGGYNTTIVSIKKGEVFDRYQSSYNPSQTVDGEPLLTGTFFSPVIDGVSFPYDMRALRNPENTAALYYKVEVLQDLTFTGESSTIIPWFDQPGEGIQNDWNIPLSGSYPISLTQLALDGLIRITIVSSPNGQYTNLAGTTIP